MRILFLTPQLPYPPRQGASLRNWGWLRELSNRHEVHLFTLLEDGQEDGLAAVRGQLASVTAVPVPARTTARRVVQFASTRTPDLALRLWSEEAAAMLARTLDAISCDIVQVEGLELVPYALPFARRSRAAWVYDAHNAEAALQATICRADLASPWRWPTGLYSLVQWHKLRAYEHSILPRFDGVVAVSEADARALEASTGVRPVVVPNGVDTQTLAPQEVAPEPALGTHPALVFTGKMDFRPNVDAVRWFASEILPRVRARIPAARFWVVGQQPHRTLRGLRTRSGIEIVGAVPRIETYLVGAAVVVAPLRMGSGTRLKILQALGLGRPVVATNLGASGLELRDGVHVRLADTAEAFAQAILDLLEDPDSASALSRAGREHVAKRFDWRVLAPRLEALYSSILTKRKGSSGSNA